jgi:hypothetical protein
MLIGPERLAPGPFHFCRLTMAGWGPNQGHLASDYQSCGRLAQLVERFVYTEDVGGSSPSSPTIIPVMRRLALCHSNAQWRARASPTYNSPISHQHFRASGCLNVVFPQPKLAFLKMSHHSGFARLT